MTAMSMPKPQCPSYDAKRDAKRRAIADARADVAVGRVHLFTSAHFDLGGADRALRQIDQPGQFVAQAVEVEIAIQFLDGEGNVLFRLDNEQIDEERYGNQKGPTQ